NRVRERQRLSLHLAREAGVPLAGARPPQRDRLGRPLKGTVQDDMHRANFGEDEPVTVEPHAIAILRIGETIVATVALEAGETRLRLTGRNSAKEGLERHFDALRHVLQDLAVDTFQRWAH